VRAARLVAIKQDIGRHLDRPDLSVAMLARRAGMSERTFARRFRDETGTTPHHWVLGQRLNLAERLLEQGGIGIEEVARRCGFSSALMLRHHFGRSRGITPTAYRRAFAGPTVAPRSGSVAG